MFVTQTCSNTLEIPNYFNSMVYAAEEMGWDPPTMEDLVEHIKHKLEMAVNEQGGYGLDTVANNAQSSRRATIGSTSSAGVGGGGAGRAAARPIVVRPAELAVYRVLSSCVLSLGCRVVGVSFPVLSCRAMSFVMCPCGILSV